MITEIGAVSLYVADRQRAYDFYVDILGFEAVTEFEVRPAGGRTSIVLLAAAPGDRTGAAPAVTLSCPDVGALQAELSAKAVAVKRHGDNAVVITDPDGYEYLVRESDGAAEFAEFTRFKRAFEQASRDKDRAAVEAMMHPDFSMVTPQGDVVSRSGVIAGITSAGSTFMPDYRRQERTIAFRAGRGVVREIADVHVGGEIPGRGAVTGDYTHSAVFVRGEHGWQFFGNTLTRKTPPAAKG